MKTATSSWSSANRRYRAWLPRHFDESEDFYVTGVICVLDCDVWLVFSHLKATRVSTFPTKNVDFPFISSFQVSESILSIGWRILSVTPNSSLYTPKNIVELMQAPSPQKPGHTPKTLDFNPKARASVRTDRHTSSLLTVHMVITPKYRASILQGEVAIECERQIKWICKTLDVDIIEMAVAEDHVHLFLQYPPKMSPSKITEKIKSNSARQLRAQFPHLVRWNKNALWAPGCFHGSVGQGFDVVEKYIARQRQYRGLST